MQLLRVVGFTYGNMVLLSSTIGTGIFVSPKEVLKYCSMNIPIFLSMWAVGGLLSLMNALCLAELATTFPAIGNLMKMAVLCLISVTGIVLLVTGDKENVTRFENGLDAELPDVSQIVEAFLQVYYSYVGSSLLINIAGEIKNPTNTIPKSLISGLSIVMVFYLLTNISYVAVLTPQEIISSDSVAVTWMYRVFPFIQWATSLGISAAMMNCLSSGLLSGSRIIYAASQDGQLPFIYSMLNDHHNPVVGAILIIILSSIAIIISKLIYLMKYVGLGAWCINFLNMIGLLKMRYQKPNLPRPYKVWLPFVFGTIVLSVFIIFIPVILSPNIEHVYQVVFLFCGLLCYWLQAHFNRHAVCFDTITCYWQLFFNVSPSEDGDNLIPSLNPD